MIEVEQGVLSKFWVPVLVALISAAAAWFTSQWVGKAAFQNAINTGFKELVDSLRAEHQSCNARLEDLERKYEAARLRGRAERAQLRGEIINMTQVIVSLENQLRAHGIPIPERIRPPAVFEALEPAGPADSLVLYQEVEEDGQ